jgi:hypothetical protein
MRELMADTVAEVVRVQLEAVSDPDLAAQIRELLVRPYCVDREWDCGGAGTTYPCWTVLEHRSSNSGIMLFERAWLGLMAQSNRPANMSLQLTAALVTQVSDRSVGRADHRFAARRSLPRCGHRDPMLPIA